MDGIPSVDIVALTALITYIINRVASTTVDLRGHPE